MEALIQVTDALRERGEGSPQDDDKLDNVSAKALWARLREGLIEECGAPRASFARMPYGKTLPSTRRLVQLAFNRTESEPHVLIAQSMVGRGRICCRVRIAIYDRTKFSGNPVELPLATARAKAATYHPDGTNIYGAQISDDGSGQKSGLLSLSD